MSEEAGEYKAGPPRAPVSFDIDDAFEEFMRKANPRVPETATQYLESRRVFYAGIAALFMFVSNDLTTLPDEEAFRELEKIKKQIDQFFHKRLGFNL